MTDPRVIRFFVDVEQTKLETNMQARGRCPARLLRRAFLAGRDLEPRPRKDDAKPGG
jgi:hypothetical protein